jgi:hypothetical protein
VHFVCLLSPDGAVYPSATDEESTTASTSAVRDIEDEIAMLQRVAGSLDRDVDAMQWRYEEQLRQLAAERLQDAVCVPPLNRNLFSRHLD